MRVSEACCLSNLFMIRVEFTFFVLRVPGRSALRKQDLCCPSPGSTSRQRWEYLPALKHSRNIDVHRVTALAQPALVLFVLIVSHSRCFPAFRCLQSYTPKKLSIRAGSSFHDLVEVTVSACHDLLIYFVLCWIRTCPRNVFLAAQGFNKSFGWEGSHGLNAVHSV